MRAFNQHVNGRGHIRTDVESNTRRMRGAQGPGHVDGRGHHGPQISAHSSVKKRSDNCRYAIDTKRQMLLTDEDILLFGLSYVGFGEEQQQVRKILNVDRFKAHFGSEPKTVKDVSHALNEEFGSSIVYKDVMMPMSWLKLCESRYSAYHC